MFHELIGYEVSGDVSGSTSPEYQTVYGGFVGSFVSTESDVELVVADNCSIDQFRFVRGVAPGSGNTVTYTFRKNGSDTLITDAISGTSDNVAIDFVHSVQLSQGDRISLKKVGSGSVAGAVSSYWHTRLRCEGGFLTFTRTTVNSVASTLYTNLQMQAAGPNSTTQTVHAAPLPTAGSITNLTILQATAPGSGKSVTYTVYINGSATALAVTISGSATTGTNNTDIITFAAGDTVSIGISFSGTPTAPGIVKIGTKVLPAIQGDSFYLSSLAGNLASNGTTQYAGLNPGRYGTIAANDRCFSDPLIIKAYYWKLNVAPGATRSRTVTLNYNGVNQAFTNTISGTNTSGSITGQSLSLGSSMYQLVFTNATTPAASAMQGGLLVHIGDRRLMSAT